MLILNIIELSLMNLFIFLFDLILNLFSYVIFIDIFVLLYIHKHEGIIFYTKLNNILHDQK